MIKIRKNSANRENRAWEIDFLRGSTVLLMAAFHTVFNLTVYYGFEISYTRGFWFVAGRLSAIMFMFVSGVSAAFSKNLLKRGLIVLGCALIVTLVSVPIMRENYIRFGILHFFGTVMIIKHFADKAIKNDTLRSLAAAAVILASLPAGAFFRGVTAPSELFLPLGMMPRGFSSYDYYPLFPWAAFFCMGAVSGEILYKNPNKRSLFLYNPHKVHGFLNRVTSAVCFLGENSLIVYLLHQPVIMTVLYVAHTLSIL